ncbi:MAG: hypothetical protein Q4E02_00740 [Lagierella massiliensis]|nr:hypothetical protein [Lagierella massiliensis]
MDNETLDDFKDFLEDKDFIKNKNKLFANKKTQKFDGNLEVFIMLYYLYLKIDKYKYLFSDEEALRDFKKIFNKKAFTVFQMAHRIRSFTSKRGRKLHFMKNSWFFREDAVYHYIKAGLYYNTPVLMISWNNKDKIISKQWNLIVGIKKTEEDILAKLYNGKDFFEVNLSYWIKSKSLYKGIAYFR